MSDSRVLNGFSNASTIGFTQNTDTVSTPSTGLYQIYIKSDGSLYIKDSTGTEIALGKSDLSNLTTTSVNQHLLPAGNSTQNLGSSSLVWGEGHIGFISNTQNISADTGQALRLTNDVGLGGIGINSDGVIDLHQDVHAANHTITNLADPTNPQDVATKNYVDNNILVFTSSAGTGSSSSEALTVPGLIATDTILAVTQKTAGGNSLPLLGYTTLADNALTVNWSANPGAGSVIIVTIKR